MKNGKNLLFLARKEKEKIETAILLLKIDIKLMQY